MQVPSQLFLLTALVSGILTLDRTNGLASDCTFLSKDPLTLRDGELLYLLPGGKEWLEVQSTSQRRQQKGRRNCLSDDVR
jgi:hypothetical protein